MGGWLDLKWVDLNFQVSSSFAFFSSCWLLPKKFKSNSGNLEEKKLDSQFQTTFSLSHTIMSVTTYLPTLAAAAASSSSSSSAAPIAPLRKHVPFAHLMSAAVLDPLRELTFPPSLPCERFGPTMANDAMLRYAGFDSFPLQPPAFPAFMAPETKGHLKVVGILDPQAIGKLDSRQSSIRLDEAASKQIPLAGNKRNRDSADDSDEVAPIDEERKPLHYPFFGAAPVPAYDVFPVSVTLDFVPSVDLKKIITDSTSVDKRNNGYTDRVWPNAIRYYRPCSLTSPSSAQHYAEFVLNGELDPHFKFGLFGSTRNGLSIVLLALAKSSSDQKLLQIAVCDYIVMVCLQFWTIVNGRWLELDPSVKASAAASSMPSYLFYFHHVTDFKSRSEVGPLRPLVAMADVLKLATENEMGFLVFITAVFSTVIQQLIELSKERNPLGRACSKLALTDAIVTHRIKSSYRTNHTQFFTTARFKMHPVRDFAKTINSVFGGTDGTVRSLSSDETTKYFPVTKHDVKMATTKIATPLDGSIRHVHPYFWSHLVVTPDAPLVMTEKLIASHLGDHEQLEMTYGIHQACVLRRLMFLLSTSAREVAFSALGHLDDFLIKLSPSIRAPVRITAKEFISRFVLSSSGEVSTRTMRALTSRAPVFLPPVIGPAVSRYCMYFENEVGRSYIPTLSRNFGSLPITNERDITGMTKQQFIALFRAGMLAKHDPKSRPIKSAADLSERERVIKRDEKLCSHFHNTNVVAKQWKTVRAIGGVDNEWTKLDPEDEKNDWIFRAGLFRLRDSERDHLLTIVNPLKHIELDETALWNLLIKISQSEMQAVSSFVYHVKRLAIKREIGIAFVLPEMSDSDLFRVLLELQEQMNVRHCVVTDMFAATWKLTGPRLGKKRRLAASAATSDSAAVIENGYSIPQQALLDELDEGWDFCTRVNIPRQAMVRFVRGMLAVDVPFIELHIASKAKPGEFIDVRHDFKPKQEEESKDSDGDQEMNDAEAAPPVVDPILSFLQQVISQVYGEYKWNEPDQNRFDLMHQDRIGLEKVAPDLPDELIGSDFYVMLIKCTAPDESILMSNFRRFFNVKKEDNCRPWTKPKLDPLICFLLWHYYTAFLCPLIDYLPTLYPETSLVQCRRGVDLRPWVDGLVPSDSTPSVSKVQYGLIAHLCDDNLLTELDNAMKQDSVISERTEATLMALQIALRTQTGLHLEESANQRLLRVQEVITKLLARKNDDSSTPSFLPVATSYTATKRWFIQEAAAKSITRSVAEREMIPRESMVALYNDLVAVCDDSDNIIEHCALVVIRAFRASQQRDPASKTVFDLAIRKWAAEEKAGEDKLMVKIARRLTTSRLMGRVGLPPRGSPLSSASGVSPTAAAPGMALIAARTAAAAAAAKMDGWN